MPSNCYPTLIGTALRKLYFRPGHPIGKARRLDPIEKILGRKKIRVRTESGFFFACDQRDWLQRNWLCNRSHEPEVTALFSEQLRHADTFFDIGANAGYFSCHALSLGVSRVLAFEPDPGTCSVLKEQLQLNGWSESRWQINQLGLSDRVGINQLILGSDSGESGFGQWPHREAIGEIAVAMTTLDAYCDLEGERPSVMKIDVEGWEYPVLCGGEGVLADRGLRLIVFEAEVDRDGRIRDQRIVALLEKCGFSIAHIRRPSGMLKPTENFSAQRD